MRKTAVSLFLATAVLTGPAEASSGRNAGYTAVVANMLEGYIRPAAAEFAAVAGQLPPAAKAVCANPSETARQQFADRYANVIRAFGGVSFLRFGPLAEEDRLSRLAFMPDPRAIAERQIRKIYAKQDPTVTGAASLANKSVAVQGLTALELIAFDRDGTVRLGKQDADGDFSCAYAAAISENVAQIALETEQGWSDVQGYSKELLTPDAALGGHIHTPKEALETLFNGLVTGIVVVKDQDILPALGAGMEKSKPNRVPFSRSKNGIAYLKAEVGGLRAAVTAADLAEALPEGDAYLVRSADFEFQNVLRLLDEVPVPVRKSLEEPASYDKLKATLFGLNGARNALAGQISGALGLSGGFNALDGD
ncbi:imelysin family protein [Roseibium sp. RKSG952]|uniref:imelysin family protein n=1 Tax=Roseibium sp. RKSG952 TaxID=2529384 RepID=UPI0012BC6B4D|nr:imelysin family protein [Roseibium sp. RKSG952]MTH96907.1 hypothetical protein [Roseibium sp. RKSG952]